MHKAACRTRADVSMTALRSLGWAVQNGDFNQYWYSADTIAAIVGALQPVIQIPLLCPHHAVLSNPLQMK